MPEAGSIGQHLKKYEELLDWMHGNPKKMRNATFWQLWCLSKQTQKLGSVEGNQEKGFRGSEGAQK